ncbi:MAG: AgrD family cyclic lactone autoinducer peptide [Porcipelethomonas sp.]
MKKTVKANVLGAVAKIARKSASAGASSASVLGFHQPKEPKALKK